MSWHNDIWHVETIWVVHSENNKEIYSDPQKKINFPWFVLFWPKTAKCTLVWCNRDHEFYVMYSLYTWNTFENTQNENLYTLWVISKKQRNTRNSQFFFYLSVKMVKYFYLYPVSTIPCERISKCLNWMWVYHSVLAVRSGVGFDLRSTQTWLHSAFQHSPRMFFFISLIREHPMQQTAEELRIARVQRNKSSADFQEFVFSDLKSGSLERLNVSEMSTS